MTKKELDSMLKDKKLGQYINSIQDETMKQFIISAIEKYGTKDKLIISNDVTSLMLDMLIKKRQLRDKMNERPTWLNVIVAAALIHNLFYDGTLPSLFQARETLTPLAKEYDLAPQAISGIFQMIEGQLGDDTPVEALIPQGNSPTGVFAWACWFIEEHNGNKEMPKCTSV